MPRTPPVALFVAQGDESDETPRGDQVALADGMRVTGTGRIVAVPDRPMRFCGNPPMRLGGYGPGQEPAPTWCVVGLDVVGLDLSALSDARTEGGATEAWARITGTFAGRVLRVEEQGPPGDNPQPDVQQAPPCPEPAGGWPAEGPGGNLPEHQMGYVLEYVNTHPSDFATFLHPSPGTAAVGFAVHDDAGRAEVEAALRSELGDALCIVDARWTQAQLDAARYDPALAPDRSGADGPAYAIGVGSYGSLQPVVHVLTVWVAPELRAAADQHQAGLVVFEPDLRPA